MRPGWIVKGLGGQAEAEDLRKIRGRLADRDLGAPGQAFGSGPAAAAGRKVRSGDPEEASAPEGSRRPGNGSAQLGRLVSVHLVPPHSRTTRGSDGMLPPSPAQRQLMHVYRVYAPVRGEVARSPGESKQNLVCFFRNSATFRGVWQI